MTAFPGGYPDRHYVHPDRPNRGYARRKDADEVNLALPAYGIAITKPLDLTDLHALFTLSLDEARGLRDALAWALADKPSASAPEPIASPATINVTYNYPVQTRVTCRSWRPVPGAPYQRPSAAGTPYSVWVYEPEHAQPWRNLYNGCRQVESFFQPGDLARLVPEATP